MYMLDLGSVVFLDLCKARFLHVSPFVGVTSLQVLLKEKLQENSFEFKKMLSGNPHAISNCTNILS